MVTINSNHYMKGAKYGHLSTLISDDHYRTILNDNTWTYDTLVDGGLYDAAAVNATNTAQRIQMETKNIHKDENFQVFCGEKE